MESHDYTTALSHAVLAGYSIYCMAHEGSPYGQICFGVMIANSVIGVWRYGNPEHGSTSVKIYGITREIQNMFALPAIAAHIWFKSGLSIEIAYAHILVPFIPFLMYLGDKSYHNTADFIITLCLSSMAFLSFTQDNWYGLASAISFAGAYFFIKDEGSLEDIPAIDLYNYSLCFFAFFSKRALAFGSGD